MNNTSENRPDNNSKGPGARGRGTQAGAAKFRTPIIVVTVIAIIILAFVAIAPPLYNLIMGPGVRTDGLHAEGASAASTNMNGTWDVVAGTLPNHSSVGFTFSEILPAEEKITSGSTSDVTGAIDIADNTLNSGLITVDMTNITTDQKKRDISVRMKLLHTDQFPTAAFEVTEPVDLSSIPDDGTVGQVVIPGTLTVHGETNDVTPTFDVLRTGEQVLIASDIEINRLDYNVEAPEFVAAKIHELGEINVRIALEK